MRNFTANILEKLSRAPMIVAAVAVAAGILLADHFMPPLWGVVVGFIVCVGMAVARYNKSFYELYIVVALMFAGGVSISLSRSEQNLAECEGLITLTITKLKIDESGMMRADGQVEQIGDKRCRFGVKLVARQEVNLMRGERLLINGRIREFAEHEEEKKGADMVENLSTVRYEEYMLRRGYRGQIYLTPEMIIERKTNAPTFAHRMQSKAGDRISRLELTKDVESIVRAVAVGDQGMISQALRRGYVASGAAHLLAVSGLHVGYIFILINIFLLPLAMLRRGPLVRIILAVGFIWMYATMTGMQPSVVRAAVMFTILQLSLAVASRYNSLNALAFTALLMMLWQAENLYDAGFQLSILAVFAIVEWVMPMMKLLYNKKVMIKTIFGGNESLHRKQGKIGRVLSVVATKGFRWIAISVMISVAASLITIPLSSYLFGKISVWSILVGPLMVLLGGATVAISIFWVVLPIGVLEGVIGWTLEVVVGWLNNIAAWCCDVGIFSFETRISFGLCVVIYFIYTVLTLIIWGTERR